MITQAREQAKHLITQAYEAREQTKHLITQAYDLVDSMKISLFLLDARHTAGFVQTGAAATLLLSTGSNID